MQKLLLLHGAINSSAQFDPLMPLLKNHCNAHAIDFSGHGGKPLPEGEFGIPLFAEDVIRWLNDNKTDCIDIFGYSMGGYVALYLAKHYPQRIGKIFTLATKFNWNPEGSVKEAAMLNSEKIEEKVPAFAKALQQKHGEHWKTVLSKTADMMISLGNRPALLLTHLTDIPHQVRVSVGDRDNMVSLEETIAMYKFIKNSQLLVLPQTQHPFEKIDIVRIAEEIKRYFLTQSAIS